MSIIGNTSNWFLNKSFVTGYQFWKVEILPYNPGTDGVGISEIGFYYDGAMNYLTGITVENLGSYLQNYSSRATAIESLVDGVIMTATNELAYGTDVIIGFTLAEPKKVTAVGLGPQGYTGYGTLNPAKSLKIFYSEDYINWIQTPTWYDNITYSPPPDETVWPPGQFRAFPTGL